MIETPAPRRGTFCCAASQCCCAGGSRLVTPVAERMRVACVTCKRGHWRRRSCGGGGGGGGSTSACGRGEGLQRRRVAEHLVPVQFHVSQCHLEQRMGEGRSAKTKTKMDIHRCAVLTRMPPRCGSVMLLVLCTMPSPGTAVVLRRSLHRMATQSARLRSRPTEYPRRS